MLTLGINAAFHDSAACMVDDGVVVAAAEEERFTGIKHGKRPIPFSAYELPFHAIDYCLSAVDAGIDDVDHVAYSFDPHVLTGPIDGTETLQLPLEPSAASASEGGGSPWDPLFIAHVLNAPRHLVGGVPHHLQKRLSPAQRRYQWHFVPHHLAHAASAFLPSPFEEAAVMALDGRGEKATTSYWAGSGTTIEPLGEVQMPHSLGLLYERVTEYLGFLHSSDEYKVMALASFGSPTQIDEFRRMVRLGRGGDYSVLPAHLERLFGPRRARGEPFERRHFDVARSLQLILEETVLELARRLRESSGLEHLCLAGGVALNCVMNARIRDSGLFREVWVQPAAGDAGTALGSALAVDAAQREPRSRSYRMNDVYLGPEYSDDEIQQLLDTSRLAYRRLDDVPSAGAELLSEGKVIGWFQGRMEFGPRALGNRSILASPASPGMQATLNEIKDREDFRPVAPVVLEDRLEEWFTPPVASPFMLFVHDVAPGKETQVPAIRHVDGTARIQTVNRRQNPRYYDLIAAFGDRTGVPVLVNTSFNTRGKPMVCSPRDAVECFMTTPLDALIIGPYLLQK